MSEDKRKIKLRFSDIHNCPKSEGKIVAILLDKFGNSYCGYCHKVVDYSRHMAVKEWEDWKEKGF